ncbi:SRPBCC family protein [Antrihabitans sp. NCIMB 15449]|uniref:SRPBCC family protein n=1 Tax=Antrihabitans spumae TaxID=3373370 RepID=A0ABW7JIR5_9NOCA
MAWNYEYGVVTSASPEAVYNRWTTMATWSEDDPDLTWARVDGPVAVGATGKVKTSGPAQRFTFTELEPNVAMNFAIRLPLAVLSFPHRIETVADGVRVTHGVHIDGPLAPLFGVAVGRKIARGLPTVVGLVVDGALRAS